MFYIVFLVGLITLYYCIVEGSTCTILLYSSLVVLEILKLSRIAIVYASPHIHWDFFNSDYITIA